MSDPSAAHRAAFNAQQRRFVEQLPGRILRAAWVWEEAFIEQGPRGVPVFEHAALCFVQAGRLELETADGTVLAVLTTQDDVDFPLFVEEYPLAERHFMEPMTEGIHRTRRFAEFPLGRIVAAAGHHDADGRLLRLTLTVGSTRVHLCAGEVQEGWGGVVRVVEADGSVLVFLGDDALAATRFEQDLRLSWA